MPRPSKPVPDLPAFHRPTGQAYVRLPDGAGAAKTVYLGPYDSPGAARSTPVSSHATRRRRDGHGARHTRRPAATVTINEILLAFCGGPRSTTAGPTTR